MSIEAQGNLLTLGRLEVIFQITMRVPWPGSWWKTFPDKEQPYALWDAKARAQEDGMELIVKERKHGKNILTLLGNSRHEMGLFLEELLIHCKASRSE